MKFNYLSIFLLLIILMPFVLSLAPFGNVNNLGGCGRDQTTLCWSWTNPTGTFFNHTVLNLSTSGTVVSSVGVTNISTGYYFNSLASGTTYLLSVTTWNGTGTSAAENTTSKTSSQATQAEGYLQKDAFSFVNQTTRDLSTGVTNFIPLYIILTLFGLIAVCAVMVYKKHGNFKM